MPTYQHEVEGFLAISAHYFGLSEEAEAPDGSVALLPGLAEKAAATRDLFVEISATWPR